MCRVLLCISPASHRPGKFCPPPGSHRVHGSGYFRGVSPVDGLRGEVDAHWLGIGRGSRRKYTTGCGGCFLGLELCAFRVCWCWDYWVLYVGHFVAHEGLWVHRISPQLVQGVSHVLSCFALLFFHVTTRLDKRVCLASCCSAFLSSLVPFCPVKRVSHVPSFFAVADF